MHLVTAKFNYTCYFNFWRSLLLRSGPIGTHGMIPLPPEIERVEKDLAARKITGDEASSIVFNVRRKLGPP